jgi:hypothetical protein
VASADELLRLYRQTQSALAELEDSAADNEPPADGTERFLRSRLEHHRAQGMRARTLEIRRAHLNVAPFTHTALADPEHYRERWLSRNRPYL